MAAERHDGEETVLTLAGNLHVYFRARVRGQWQNVTPGCDDESGGLIRSTSEARRP